MQRGVGLAGMIVKRSALNLLTLIEALQCAIGFGLHRFWAGHSCCDRCRRWI